MTRRCRRCGRCCRSLTVEADHVDVLREPRLLRADLRNGDRGRPATMRELANREAVVLLASPGEPCGFLGADGLCAIWPTRPYECVAFRPGGEQCRECRAEGTRRGAKTRRGRGAK